MARHAEVAGGGIGGLGIGMMLARQGWSVRVHERSSQIREIGAGISLRNNCIQVLEHYGVFPHLEPYGSKIEDEHHFDRNKRFTQSRDLTGHHRTHVFPRQALVDALAHSARDAGAEIVTSSTIVGADSNGALIDQTGARFPGDLIVAADGLHSAVRTCLDFGATRRKLGTVVNRYLLNTRAFTQRGTMHEHWSGDRRVGIMPSGVGKSFVYAVMPAKNHKACEMPINVDDWEAAFPHLRQVFEVLRDAEATQFSYPLVTTKRWSVGKVALIGDAAHAMPPSLAQGASLTLMNSHALSSTVCSTDSIEVALQRWERKVRFLTDITQRWGVRYDRFTKHWPSQVRPFVIQMMGRIRFLNERMRIADRGLSITGIPIRESS